MTTTNPLRKTTLSYEVFPPKTQVGEDNLFQVLQASLMPFWLD